VEALEDEQDGLDLALAEQERLTASSVRWRRWFGSWPATPGLYRHVQELKKAGRRAAGSRRA